MEIKNNLFFCTSPVLRKEKIYFTKASPYVGPLWIIIYAPVSIQEIAPIHILTCLLGRSLVVVVVKSLL